MDKRNHPTSNGVFMPVGHVVISFPTARDMAAAQAAMHGLGLHDEAVTPYTAQEMAQQAQADLEGATGLASIGQDLNLVKSHLELARAGHHFLVVEAANDDLVAQVAQTARLHRAERAQSYGRFMIEELIMQPGDTPQVAESPDRGLDT
jgi:hypothetical protein